MGEVTLEKVEVGHKSGQFGYKVLNDAGDYVGRVVKRHDGTFEARTRGKRGRGVKVADGVRKRSEAVQAVIAA